MTLAEVVRPRGSRHLQDIARERRYYTEKMVITPWLPREIALEEIYSELDEVSVTSWPSDGGGELYFEHVRSYLLEIRARVLRAFYVLVGCMAVGSTLAWFLYAHDGSTILHPWIAIVFGTAATFLAIVSLVSIISMKSFIIFPARQD